MSDTAGGGLQPSQAGGEPHRERRDGALTEAGWEGLLAEAAARAAERTGAERAAAWTLGGPGPAGALVHRGEPAPEPLATTTLEALGGLAHAVDLGDPSQSEALAALGREGLYAAAVPIAAGGGAPRAVILVGGGALGAPGEVRPRSLAALEQVSARLQGPTSVAAARDRLASLDDDLLRVSRLAALGDLLAEVVHEVRNPLVSVKTFLELLPQRRDDPEFEGEFREMVVEEVRRIERLLDALLEHARPGRAGGGERVEAGEVLPSVARLLEHRARDRAIALAVDVAADLPRIAIGEDALRQIALNLTLNALEATPAGGRVRLVVALAKPGESVELAVEDEGPGVPRAQRERLFEPFFSTRSERPGGLGLGVCKRLCDEAGGTIAIDDAPGGGARFRVTLPVAD